MYPQKLILRCMAWRSNGQWVAMCLDFDLAAQADSFDEAKLKLAEQMLGYVRDALVGPEKDQAAYFLYGRRAPLRYWLKYYWARLRAHVDGWGQTAKPYCAPLPLKPA